MKISIPFHELEFKAVRSGGKGGQNVNKVSTRVELYFNIRTSEALNDEQKETLLSKLKNKINEDGILRLTEDGERSQLANKEKVIRKLHKLLTDSLRKPKKRIPTKVSRAAKAKRVDEKKKKSEIKKLRSEKF